MTIYVAARSDAHLGTTHFATSRASSMGGLRQFANAWYAPGSRVCCDGREIPQVGETYALIGSGPTGLWGFDCGVNEHALAVGHEAIATREPAESKRGLSGRELVRLGLERGRNAREALEVVAALVERFGHGRALDESANSRGLENDLRFLFADPSEAWCFESAGRRWAARRLTRRIPSATLLEPEIRDDWEIGAKGLESYARERRWCEGPGRLDFAAIYSEREPIAIAEDRGTRSIGLSELVTHLRETAAPTASFGVALPHDRHRPWPLWVSAGPAAVGVFLPVYLDALLPVEARLAADGEFGALAHAAGRQPELVQARLREAWKGFEADLERERRFVERSVAELVANEQGADAHRELSGWSAALWSRAAQRAAELADLLLT